MVYNKVMLGPLINYEGPKATVKELYCSMDAVVHYLRGGCRNTDPHKFIETHASHVERSLISGATGLIGNSDYPYDLLGVDKGKLIVDLADRIAPIFEWILEHVEKCKADEMYQAKRINYTITTNRLIVFQFYL